MFHGTITKELTSHEEWRHYNDNMIEDQKDFVFVKFSGLHLKSMENLQSCISLRVCIFSNNFITDIHPLQSCIRLVKLDLHGNQIKSLPDTKFWSGLKKLKLLYLHDNGFSKLKNICMLSACPSLIALTMFDCPVSLKKGYRHVLVNSIWPLKALDHHVISDEEIIQNWHLPERFRAYNHRLFFNFCPALKKGSTYGDEINNIKYIVSKINEILSHNSPVLIVQRWIRGFLVRKKMSPLLHKKHQEKFIGECETKWTFIPKGYEDSLFKHLFLQPETNRTGKLAHWKRVSQKESEDETEGEELDASFRISVFKLPIHTSGSLKYAALLKEKEQDYFPTYVQPFSTTHQKPEITKKDMLLKGNVRKEFFTTHRTGIKLRTLCDIDKCYSEQKKQESHKKKITAVTLAQVAQERVSLAVQENLNKKKNAAQKLIAKDNETIRNGLQQLWQDRFNYLEKVKERRAQFLKEKKQKAEDRLLIQNISNERTLLCKGMIKMDRLRKNQAVLQEKSLIVQQRLEMEKYQKNLLKQMKEIRAQETYKKHCEEKFVIDMIIFQKACERFQDAKTKVALVRKNLVFKVPNGTTK
ncbi:leucine-rich repeat and IQ domain-containing protein 3 [Panthera uncia]|uniref:leucine-rich repeat and IQ domain-containing protein 3 n=1 Tax=Panthera uncia TaxID=29064 RepID=UPI0020FFBD4C|nr:leucine-rich repeat and IQ domain-containing protein 3 [Panthera uncia]